MSKHKAYELALNDKKLMPVIAYGSAGTGKTYGAVAAAIKWLEKKGTQVIITRPNVSFAKEGGFLPGDEREKMAPWIRPIQQNFLHNGVGKGEQEILERQGRLVYIPLEFIQGLTWDNSFVIVDECQNMTFKQLQVFLTRIGKWSKVVLCGDVAQISPEFSNSGLAELIDMVNHFDMNVHTINFNREDILRGETCKMFIEAFEDWEVYKNGQ